MDSISVDGSTWHGTNIHTIIMNSEQWTVKAGEHRFGRFTVFSCGSYTNFMLTHTQRQTDRPIQTPVVKRLWWCANILDSQSTRTHAHVQRYRFSHRPAPHLPWSLSQQQRRCLSFFALAQVNFPAVYAMIPCIYALCTGGAHKLWMLTRSWT